MNNAWNDFCSAVRDGDRIARDGGPWLEREPLFRHATFRIGGEADAFLEPVTEAGLCYVLRQAHRFGVRCTVVGRASNLLFDDAGYRGVIVSTSGLHTLMREGNTLTVGAGVPLTAAACAALDASLTGLEFAYGIPGSCGGAVYMNAGAYGGEVAQCLQSSRAYHVPSGEIRKLSAEEHRFGYRTSVYREHPDWIILSAQFALTPGSVGQIRAAMDDHMRSRAEKQPLEYPSAGSVFKRCPGHYTAQMIDEAGLKGRRIGGAEVSVKHAGFIVNRGGATSADVLALIEEIRGTLAERYGVDIETEVIYIPTDGTGIGSVTDNE